MQLIRRPPPAPLLVVRRWQQRARGGGRGFYLKTANIGGVTVLTNVEGFAVYSFAPDTMTKSDCTGACAAAWPPVQGLEPPPEWV